MKKLFYIITLIVSQSLYSQITYKPIFINQCTNKIVQKVNWRLSDSIKTYGNDYYGMDHAILPKKGKYILNCSSVSSAPISITIKNNGTVRDTFFLRGLNALLTIKSSKSNSNTPNIPPKYYFCNSKKPANGKITDYYFNGKKREEGTFKNGKLVGRLSSYYRNGALYEVNTPKKKGSQRIMYFENGQIKTHNNFKEEYKNQYDKKDQINENENEKKLSWRKWSAIEYYSNGTLKSKLSTKIYKKRKNERGSFGPIKKEQYWGATYKIKGKEYFPDGTLKIKRRNDKIEIYNKSAVLLEKIQSKKIKNKYFINRADALKSELYKYKWERFDTTGIINRRIIFKYDKSFLMSFPKHGAISNLLFEEIISFVQGKEYEKVVCEYVKERNEFTEKLVLYRKVQEKWIEKKRIAVDNESDIVGSIRGLHHFIYQPLDFKRIN